jgi:hypothetical protein
MAGSDGTETLELALQSTSYDQANYYFGRGQSILAKRERIKKRTIAKSRLHYQQYAAQTDHENQNSTLAKRYVCSVCWKTDMALE